MRTPARLLVAAFFLALLVLPHAFNASGAEPYPGISATYAPKFALRSDNGTLTNHGTAGGTSSVMLGVDVAFLYYWNSWLATGAGYRADFDYANYNLPHNGFNFMNRYYFWGQGTWSRVQRGSVISERHDRWAFYLLTELAQRNYFIGSNISKLQETNQNADSSVLTGSYLGINVGGGIDFRLSRHFEITFETNYGLYTFASSDDRIKVKGLLFIGGINYVW
ncbi:MAG: hypothetical protein A2583_10345 [Bdellovibrionales bacterium RIFOXYD1_FULL_53_11]|nr:MAG: hypothetical protein A2583_10345 [Bdellovibrionales bacterium RIFOXYD1_FULL_53_11]